MSALESSALVVDYEQELLNDILLTPWIRTPVVKLAEYYESKGALDLASELYRGQFPPEIKAKFALEFGERAQSKDSESCERLSWHPRATNQFDPVSNSDAGRNSVFEEFSHECLPEYAVSCHQATLVHDSYNSLVLDEEGCELSDFTTSNGFLLHTFLKFNTIPEIELKGKSIQLAARNESNFYHWQYDHLIKLSMLELSGIKLEEIDNFVIGHRSAQFQRASLNALGVPDEKVVQIPEQLCVMRCEQLLLAKVYNRMGRSFRPHHLDWLRTQFKEVEKNNSPDNQEKLAIVREERGFSNSDEAYRVLERKGYRLLKPENYSFTEQIALFQNASSVVAPHGAALALIGYMKEGAEVYEFYGAHVQPCFWTLANFAGLNYSNYNCSEIIDAAITSSNKGLSDRLKESMTVDLDILDSIH